MRAKKAKYIRKLVYGKGTHPGPVVYYLKGGTVIADHFRRIYQDTKKGNR